MYPPQGRYVIKVNPNIEELGQLQCFNTEQHLNNTEEKKQTALETTLGQHDPKRDNNRDSKEIMTETRKESDNRFLYCVRVLHNTCTFVICIIVL